jgi:hypothetical protein
LQGPANADLARRRRVAAQQGFGGAALCGASGGVDTLECDRRCAILEIARGIEHRGLKLRAIPACFVRAGQQAIQPVEPCNDFWVFVGCWTGGFSPGCEMMDFDGDSNVHADDVADCFVSSPSDCNGNGTEDVAEIMLDLGLDADQNFLIDCCESGTADDPNPVGDTLLLDKDGSENPVLGWIPPVVDGTHGAAISYDVFRTEAVLDVFGFLANVGPTTHTDTNSPDQAFYLVGARNGCGSSGEEPF